MDFQEFIEHLETIPQKFIHINSIKKDASSITEFLIKSKRNLTQADYFILTSLVNQVKTLKITTQRLDEEVMGIAMKVPSELARRIEIASSLPAASTQLAIRIAVEFGDVNRFSNRRKAGRYTGLDVVIRSSGGKTHLGRISKTGNKNLRRHLFMIAKLAIMHNRKFRSYYLRMKNVRKLKYTQIVCARTWSVTLIELGNTQWKNSSIRQEVRERQKYHFVPVIFIMDLVSRVVTPM